MQNLRWFFMTIVNGFQSLTIVTKSPMLDFASVTIERNNHDEILPKLI